jgi:crotonobetainyl-CoA:carnitine CoA-transferase CaiB-like acyl-CoA transferase
MNIGQDDRESASHARLHRTGPLAGVRVLDFTHALAGPIATMYLGDLGADVIKIEHPTRGDGTRHMGRPMSDTDGRTDYFLSLNRNKRSVGLHLKRPEDVAVVRRLVATCDVVVHNFRPGVMERLGFGYDDLVEVRPDLVYVAISGFGEEGPLRDRGANDITVQAMGGLMSTTGELGGAPLRIGISVVDISTGLYAVSGVLAALYHRATTGEGQRVHVSMLKSAVSLLANYVPGVLGVGDEIPTSGRGHAQLVPYQSFEAADGGFVIVGAFTQAFWQRYCGAIGHPELAADPRYASNALRLRHRDELVPLLEQIMLTRPRDEWLALLEEADVPNAPVLSVGETLRLPQTQQTQGVVELVDGDDSVWMAGLPIELSKTPGDPHGFPPLLGADTEAVLAELTALEQSAATSP